MSRNLSVPDQHALSIARRTLVMSEWGARVMGGPDHKKARETIYRLTGKHAPMLSEHGDWTPDGERWKRRRAEKGMN